MAGDQGLFVLDVTRGAVSGFDAEGQPVGEPWAPGELGRGARLGADRGGTLWASSSGGALSSRRVRGERAGEVTLSGKRGVDAFVIDARGSVYAASTLAGLVVKHDASGAVVAARPVEAPTSLFMSRARSGERFVGAYASSTGLFTVLLAATLEVVKEQLLAPGVASFLNVERVNPEVVYVAFPELDEVVAYKDHDRAFHDVARFKVAGGPFGLIETDEGVVVSCRRSRQLLVQRSWGSGFEPLVAELPGEPSDVALAPLGEARP